MQNATIPHGTAAAATLLYGDADLNEIIITNAVLLNQAIFGTVILNEEQVVNADCVKDGVEDSTALMQFLICLVGALPIDME